MKNLLRILLATAVLLPLFSACEKEEGCLTGYGEQTSETRTFQPFDEVYLEGRMDVEYRRDSIHRVVVHYGSNLLEGIVSTQTGSVLHLSNSVDCLGLRDPGKVAKIEIHAPHLSYMSNRMAGDITFRDTLVTDAFKYEQWQSNGKVSLLLHTDTARIFAHVGYTSIRAAGRTRAAELYTANSGPLRAVELHAETVWSNNSSIQDLTLYASDYLYAFVGRSGSTRYAGNPNVVDRDVVGSGVVRAY